MATIHDMLGRNRRRHRQARGYGDDIATGAQGAADATGDSALGAGAKGAATGAAVGGTVGNVAGPLAGAVGAAVGAIVGFLAGIFGADVTPAWLVPDANGNYPCGDLTYWVIATGLARGVDPWDLGAGLVAGDMASPGANLMREAFQTYPGLRNWGRSDAFPDGFMMKEDVEACCFMLAQIWGIKSVARTVVELGEAMAWPQGFDLGDGGEQAHATVRRTVLQIMKDTTPAPPFAMANKVSAVTAAVTKAPTLARGGLMAAAQARIRPTTAKPLRPRQRPRAASATAVLPIAIGVGVLGLVAAAVLA